ncbi:hypothetical protein AgCh_028221 [Apium graveolens]
MAIGSRFSFADMQNPLFLHPSDGPTSINVAKLQGSKEYRTWRRSIEIQLASKRKLGFVIGSERRSATDATDGVQWDTCNNMYVLNVERDVMIVLIVGVSLVIQNGILNIEGLELSLRKEVDMLLKMLPTTFSANKSEQEELDSPFSGMVSFTSMPVCYNVQSSQQEWIVDSGMTDHMTSNLSLLSDVKLAPD